MIRTPPDFILGKRFFAAFGTATLLVVFPFKLEAQTSPWIRVGAHGVILSTYADPVPGGRSLTEVRLVQPTIMAHAAAFSDRLRLVATIDLEGLTIPDGELTPGAWGEGFVDRRHPHTYMHELMLSSDDVLGSADGSARVSVAVGKGFAPFGTDDPMSRPVVRYPVNHHLAQILERALVIAGAGFGPIALELGLFNGDEPEHPGQWPRLGRWGDSWSARLTALPLKGLELQSSYAVVQSPEHRSGAGTDQHKWSLSGRWDQRIAGFPVYGLVELVRTTEAEGFFVFRSFLAEGAWTQRASRLHYRFERTTRPEEERTLSPFRTVRPHLENSLQGITRWTLHTIGYAYRLESAWAAIAAQPFAEVTYGRIAEVRGGLFDVRSFYGQSSFWSVSFGLRVNYGMRLHRMGRYGVVEASEHEHHIQQSDRHDQ